MEALAADLIISRSKLPKEEQNLTQKEKTKKSDFERVYYMSVRNEALEFSKLHFRKKNTSRHGTSKRYVMKEK